MATVKNGAPRFLFDGLNDISPRDNVIDPLQIPTHLPLFLLRTSWGPESDEIVSGDRLFNTFGADIYDRRSPYFSHQSLLSQAVNEAANQQMICRITGTGAKRAGKTIWGEWVVDDIVNYERNSDGSHKVNAQGQKVVSTTRPKITGGTRIRITSSPLKDNTLGQQEQATGDLISNKDGKSSTKVPLFDIIRPHKGAAGDRGGFRLMAPTIKSAGGTREGLIEDQRAFLYRFQAVERKDARSSALTKQTISGEQYVEFTFKPDVYDRLTNAEYGIDDTLVQAYNARSTDGGPHTFGTFSGYHVYEKNLELFLKAIHAAEIEFGTAGDDVEDFHMVNFLTGQSYLGYPYYSIQVETPANGGLLFTDTTTHFAEGGDDGDISDEAYDKACGDWLDNFMNNENRLWDRWRVPMSCMYDSGFSLETKLKFPQMLANRDDIYLVMSTQVWGQPMNSEAEDYSIGVSLKNALLGYPESVLHGTQCCRAIILGHAGEMPKAKVKSVVPLTYKFAKDCAAYMGAGDGIWVAEKQPDDPKNNVVKDYTEINARSKSEAMIDNFWANGICWAQYKDRRDQFVPAYQTVYEDDTSVLNSAFNMIVAVDVIKVCRAVWTELVGIKGLTEAQFIQKSNDKIAKAVAGKYDGRVTVVPDTYFTPADSSRGFSWSCNVTLYMGTMRTVGSFTVLTDRLDALNGTETAQAA
jgi:hypothetical protein